VPGPATTAGPTARRPSTVPYRRDQAGTQRLPHRFTPPTGEEDAVSQNDDWSPDEPLGTEAFEQGDEALDEDSRIDAGFVEEVEVDPSLDPTLQVDERELEEAGAELDDPEDLVTLDGGMDDPDGLGEPTTRARSRQEDEGGWRLDAPLAGDEEPDGGSTP